MFGHKRCLQTEKKPEYQCPFFTCAMYEAARERPPTVTPSFLEEKIDLIEMLATMSLAFVIVVLDITEFDEPAGSPNSLVACWISFPKSIV